MPDYLQNNFRALESVAYKIKKKHPQLKRNVKLDDDSMDLIMDIKISDNAEWNRILPSHAKEAGKAAVGSQAGGAGSTLGADDIGSLMGDEDDDSMQ